MTPRPIPRHCAPYLLAAVLLSGCLMGPDFVKPAAPASQRISARPLPAATVATPIPGGESQRFVEGGVLPAQWWKSFGSPLLDGWVDEALAHSPTLAAARATLEQQQALLGADTGLLYPSVTANAGATRRKTSSAAFGGGNVRGSIFNLYQASVDVSYGLDLWGGTRRGLEGQNALVAARQYQTSAAYLTLVGNVVTSAVAVAAAQAQVQLAADINQGYQRTVQLKQKQYALGAIAKSELLTVQSQQAQFAPQIPQLQQQLVVARNRLAVLLGRLPSEFDSGAFDLTVLTLPQDIPVALPSELVRRRPDIAAAEAQLAVASANVGIASANQFPALNLTASIGTQASRPKDLFDQSIWSLAANLTAPIFDGRNLRYRKKAAVSAYQVAQAEYRGTVLKAFNEVADALSAVDNDSQLLAAQQNAYALASQAEALTDARYRSGSAASFELSDAQLTTYAARQNLLRALASRYQDTAALFQALGGDGWNRSAPEPATATTASITP